MFTGPSRPSAMRAVVMLLAVATLATGLTFTSPIGGPAEVRAVEPPAPCPAGQVLTWVGSQLICSGPLSVDDGPDALLHRGALNGGVHTATLDQQSALARISQQAVENTATAHGVPTDLAAVRTWGRADAQSELWGLLVQAIKAPLATRTADQQLAVDWMGAMVRRQGVEVARAAGAELASYTGLSRASYDALFAGGTEPTKAQLEAFLAVEPLNYNSATKADATAGYCVYRSPAPYGSEYTGYNDITCSVPCPVVGVCDDPMPPYQSFMKWGAASYRGQAVNAEFAGASRLIAIGVALGGVTTAAVTGALISSTLGSALAGTAFVNAIFPHASTLVQVATRGYNAATTFTTFSIESAAGVASGGQVGAAAAGFIGGVVVFFIVGVTIRSIFLFEDLAVPYQVAQAIVDARTATHDLPAMLASQDDAFTLWSLFIGATLPEPRYDACNNAPRLTGLQQLCLNAPAIPAAAAGDAAFLVSTHDPVDLESPDGILSTEIRPEITFASGIPDGKYFTTARLHETWFVQRIADFEIQSFRIRYIDWWDQDQTVWLIKEPNGLNTFFGIPDGTCVETVAVGDACLGPQVDPVNCEVVGTCWRTGVIRYRGQGGTYEMASVREAGPLTWAPPPPITYGDPLTDDQLNATAAVPGAFAYTLDGAPVDPTDRLVLDAGTYVLGVTFTPTDTTRPPGGATNALVVTKAPLSLVASSHQMPYGGTVPTVTSSYDGWVNDDDASDALNVAGIAPTITCSTTATSASPLGAYPTTCSAMYIGGAQGSFGLSPRNYTLSPVNGSVTIGQATLTVTASGGTMPYGNAVPAIQPLISGFVVGDDATDLTTPPTCSTTATSASSPALYTTTCSGGSATNYAFTYVSGWLDVTRRPLGIVANDVTKTYGDAVTFDGTEFTAPGLVNGDTVTSVTLASSGAAATATVAGSPYAIVPSAPTGTGLTNYVISFIDGDLTVEPRDLTVRANDGTKTYGETLAFAGTEFTVEGLTDGDTVTSVSLASDGATASAGVGDSPYTIVASDATGTGLANYDVAYLDGELVVNRAPLTITAASHDVVAGGAIPEILPAYDGFVADDDADALVTAPTCSTTALPASPMGSYPSACDGAESPNYSIGYTEGIVNITNGTVALFDESLERKTGSSVPIKVQLLDASGQNVSSPDVTVTLASPALAPSPATASQPTGEFRFVRDRKGDFYQYDLKTSRYATGTYTVFWQVQDDPVTHSVTFVLKR